MQVHVKLTATNEIKKWGERVKMYNLLKVFTIENISLDLGPCVAEFIERITCFISQSTILYRSYNIHKNIVLKNKKTILIWSLGSGLII